MRKIIKIDRDKCTGCGACATACHEGAIEMIDGKAQLVREDYCDGLGDCIGACPFDAISFEVKAEPKIHKSRASINTARQSKLAQWPCQLRLVPVSAPYFDGSDLLIAADCTAFAYGNFHEEFISGRITLIGCPKLDIGEWAEKLEYIICENDIRSVTVARMEVPCCSRLENAVRLAVRKSQKNIPLDVVTISTDGKVLEK